ncbi:MAG TPA: hypothetical protein VIS71_08815 [Terrimicrobium sp.]
MKILKAICLALGIVSVAACEKPAPTVAPAAPSPTPATQAPATPPPAQ